MRTATVARETKETRITVTVALDGSGRSMIATGVGFFDHMLDQLARHSLIDMEIAAEGDLHIDDHHTVEDTGIALGQAIRQALGDRAGITRYADALLPMDETLTRAAVDVSGRPFLVFRAEFPRHKIRDIRCRTGARVFPGVRDERRHHAAPRDAVRHQCSSYRRILLQGRRAGAEDRGRHRPAPGWRDPVDQGDAVVALYVVQARGEDVGSLERARFIPDGFSWPAFVLAQLWLLYHRLWLALAIYVAAEIAFYFLVYPHVPLLATLVVDLLARLYVGFEGNRLRVARESRKAALTDIVGGADRDEAEAAFFGQQASLLAARDEAAA